MNTLLHLPSIVVSIVVGSFLAIALAGCAPTREGERCNPSRTTDECATGLTCTTPDHCAVSVCCRSDGHDTNPNCAACPDPDASVDALDAGTVAADADAR